MPKIGEDFLGRHFEIVALILVLVGAVFLYTHSVTSNPAGFYIDESSIAYNAHLIAQTGRDEHGVAWPLYFRAFGDYKNPVYVYLLAGIFRVTGPGIATARLFSAVLGIAGALLIGLLAWRITKQRAVGFVVALTALLMPWIFELSRVAVEVALYPLLIALFLLSVWRAAKKERWGWRDGIGLALTLALLTYSYSIGRALGPLLSLGLLIFVRRAGLSSVLRTWVLYGISLVPLLIFNQNNPGALTARYRLISYVTPQTSYWTDAREFIKHLLGNMNPWRMVVSGDPNVDQIASVPGAGPVLLAVLLLVAGSLILLWRERRFNSWWLFVVYGLTVSFVPASLTKEYFHTLRLAAVPVFLLTLTVPAFAWMLNKNSRRRRDLLALTIVLALIQAVLFQSQFRARADWQRRLDLFDADYTTRILDAALRAAGNARIYIADQPSVPGYIQALWYATLLKIPREKIVVLSPDESAPESVVVISTEDTCPRCVRLLHRWPYSVYVAEGPPRKLARLSPEGFRAEIRVINYSPRARPGQAASIRVAAKNISPVAWLTRERAAEQFQINIGNHWLSADGRMIVNDDGRATLMYDLHPGQEVEFVFTVNAPRETGQYLLEIDMLQEGVSWFGLKGSTTLRLPVRVE